MNKIIGGVVRAGLAAAGGYLVSKGLATTDNAAVITNSSDAISGVITVIAAAAWSWWSKRKAV